MKVAVVGLGVGMRHVDVCISHPEVNLVAVCDFDQALVEQVIAKRRSVRGYNNFDQMMEVENLDLLIIASYDNYHFLQLSRAVEAGIHVFVEKPICLHNFELQKIKDLLHRNSGIEISSNLVLRTSPRFKTIKEQIASGHFGDIFNVFLAYDYGRFHKILSGWRGTIPGFSVMHSGGIHVLDLLLFLCPSKPNLVVAMGNSVAATTSGLSLMDSKSALIQFDNGMTGNVMVNFASNTPHFHRLSVYGTRATYDQSYSGSVLIDEGRDQRYRIQGLDPAYKGCNQADILTSFISSLLGTGESIVKVDDVLRSMALSLAVDQSICDQGPVVFKS